MYAPAGRITALATRYAVSTQVASSWVAPRPPAMCGSATLAMEESSTSMNVASVTVMATIHGLTRGRQAACGLCFSFGLGEPCAGEFEGSRGHESIVSIPLETQGIQFFTVFIDDASKTVQVRLSAPSVAHSGAQFLHLVSIVLRVQIVRQPRAAGLLFEGLSLFAGHRAADGHQVGSASIRRKHLWVQRRIVASPAKSAFFCAWSSWLYV